MRRFFSYKILTLGEAVIRNLAFCFLAAFFNANDAMTLFGTGYVEGAIMVKMK